MIIGVPKEIKTRENRVAATPAAVTELTHAGHKVLVEKGAGGGSGISDAAFAEAGAHLADAATVWGEADIITKVKEPLEREYDLMREGQVLFTYLHLAASEPLTDALLKRRVTGIAYETVTGERGLPLLAPMSEVAGKLSIQVGAYHLMQAQGGAGILPGGVTGTRRANVTVIGAGIAGENAARVAMGMGANVTVIDINLARLRDLGTSYGDRLNTLPSNRATITTAVASSDLVIGSVLIPGASAPKLVTADMVEQMRPGSVLVDIAIDQGGCFEGSRPTTHDDPTFLVGDKIYYCVANMPGAVPQTSTAALTNATMPYLVSLANNGWRKALASDPHLARGLNTYDGAIVHPAVAQALGREYVPFEG